MFGKGFCFSIFFRFFVFHALYQYYYILHTPCSSFTLLLLTLFSFSFLDLPLFFLSYHFTFYADMDSSTTPFHDVWMYLLYHLVYLCLLVLVLPSFFSLVFLFYLFFLFFFSFFSFPFFGSVCHFSYLESREFSSISAGTIFSYIIIIIIPSFITHIGVPSRNDESYRMDSKRNVIKYNLRLIIEETSNVETSAKWEMYYYWRPHWHCDILIMWGTLDGSFLWTFVCLVCGVH